jgi:hypothetical protein
MNIRDPLVHATYYYLREMPGDSPARRHDRHEAFVADASRMVRSLAGWLSIPAPAIPAIPAWESAPLLDLQPLMQTGELQGRIPASAWLTAYALRNMLLLRVVVMRVGEYEPSMWALLDEALGSAPTTPSWLHTTRYWCGFAPRPPEELEQDRSLPIKAPFGVLLLGSGTAPHLLVYPDARTEGRASAFLRTLSAQLDWHLVQARYRLADYEDRASDAVRAQQTALEQVAQTMRDLSAPGGQQRLRSLMPLQMQLQTLETTYEKVLADLAATKSTAQELRTLMADYRLMLMQSGLWDAAPTLWEAQVAALATMQGQIESDVYYIDATLHRIDLLMRGIQARMALLQSERERLLFYAILGLGVAALTVLIADASLARMGARLLALVIVAGVVWIGWRVWLRARVP